MRHHRSIKKANLLYGISLIAFFSGLHLSIPVYFNSSFLSTLIDEKTISLIYLIISSLTIFGLLLMHNILARFGNLRTSIALILLQSIVFYQFINAKSSSATIAFFILSMSIISLIIFTLDIFIQKSTDIGHTGRIRGLVMTISNIAWILGPLIGGMLISGDSYRNVYIASFTLLFPMLYLIQKNFNNFHDSKYTTISARETVVRILDDKDISKVFMVNIILQSFYAWMTVYIPIYLHNVIHFSFAEISIIFTIMLIPFVLVDIPLGKLADKKWGEKEMMAIGFLIMAISTGSLFLFTVKSVFVWAAMLFITRIGAATAELMIETYFFKKVDGRDPEVLSMFRITRPLSYFVAPLIVTISLVYTTEQNLFLVFGVLCLLTVYPILKIKDTN
jgi:predicted MFS family arabinose efflux permease